MKKILLLLLVVCSQLAGFEVQAQSFYESQFKSNDVLYDVLVIYYDDNDLLVRTRYKLGDKYKVAEFSATAQIVTLDTGEDCYLIDGGDASIVYGDNSRGYSADNYIFYKDDSGAWGKPYVIDDEGWESSDPDSHMFQTNFWRQVDPTETFTEQYVFNFFDRDEKMYNILLAYNPNNVTDVAGVNGSGTTSSGEWKVFMSKGTGYGEQSWVTRYQFPKEKIDEYWAQQKSITDLSYGNGLWMVNMSKNSGYGTQAWKYGASWPNEWIDKQWSSGRRITEVAYGNGQWALVMSNNSGYSKQIYSVSKDWPKAWLDEHWKNGTYSITSIAYGAGHWVAVLSKHSDGSNPGQRIRAGAEFPADDVSACWSEDYDVTTMAYGDEWVVILTKGQNLIQSYDEGTSFPKAYVKEKWDAGYAMSEAIYTYKEPEAGIVLNFTGTASSGGTTHNTIANTSPSTNNTNTTPNTATIAAVPRLHLITVANTKVPDIGNSCLVDKNNVIDEFTDIASGLGIELKKHTVDGTNLSKANVRNAINNMSVKSNDIVVFVYTGHGFRWSDQSSKYPMMALFYSRYDAPSNSNSYNLKEVYDLIVGKGARLNIVLGDCCNNDIGVTSRGGGGGLASRSYTRGSTDRLRKLFFEARGNIIAGAAQPGETACGSSVGGGYFLNAFFSAIDKEVSYTATGTQSWDAIMTRAMSSATYKTQNLNGCDTQHGVHRTAVAH